MRGSFLNVLGLFSNGSDRYGKFLKCAEFYRTLRSYLLFLLVLNAVLNRTAATTQDDDIFSHKNAHDVGSNQVESGDVFQEVCTPMNIHTCAYTHGYPM
jgi:hypothetical protein